MQVVDRIYQVQLPLPFALRSVNCYLLRDDDGWTIVDCGLHTAAGQSAWQAAFASLGIAPGAINKIVLTHFHPDHFGLAGWLQQWNGTPTPVYMAPREAELARRVWGLPAGAPEPMQAHFVANGAPPDMAVAIAATVRDLRQKTLPHPVVSELLAGAPVCMGGREFVALHTPGHSDGHLIFYAAAERLVLCGDHVLVKISPHIGAWPESEPDPLDRFLMSLRELETLAVDLALPGHGPLITSWRERLQELQQHHAARLAQTLVAVGSAADAYHVSQQLFDFNRLTPHEMRFALAETLAHLEYLAAQERLRCEAGASRLYYPMA